MRDFKRQESWARRELRRPLSRAIRLTNDALKLGLEVVQKESALTAKSGRAMMFLTTRLLNEVRACEILAQTGYPLQSLSLAASAFELAYRALYVGDNEGRAAEWAAHDDIRYSYPRNLREAVRDFYRARGKPQRDADLIYDNRYKPLAAAKHANPKAVSQFGYEREGDTLHIYVGPVREPATIRACQIALVECNRLLGMVLANLIEYHMPKRKEEFEGPLTKLFRRTQALGTALPKPTNNP